LDAFGSTNRNRLPDLLSPICCTSYTSSNTFYAQYYIIFRSVEFFGHFCHNSGIPGAEHHKSATLTQTSRPDQFPFPSFSDSVHRVTNAVYTVWYIYCPWVSTTITHLTCAVSDLLPLLPDLSSHYLQIPGISSIFRSSYGVFCM